MQRGLNTPRTCAAAFGCWPRWPPAPARPSPNFCDTAFPAPKASEIIFTPWSDTRPEGDGLICRLDCVNKGALGLRRGCNRLNVFGKRIVLIRRCSRVGVFGKRIGRAHDDQFAEDAFTRLSLDGGEAISAGTDSMRLAQRFHRTWLPTADFGATLRWLQWEYLALPMACHYADQ